MAAIYASKLISAHHVDLTYLRQGHMQDFQ